MLSFFSRLKAGGKRQAEQNTESTKTPTRDGATAKALVRQGNQLLATDDIVQANACYRQAVACDPGNASAYLCLGYTLLETQQYDEARQALLRGAALDPRNADARYMLGGVAKMQNDHAGVVREMGAAIAIDPTFERAYPDLCISLFRLSRLNDVLNLTERGIALFPHRADLHFYRADVFVEGNKPELALESYLRADQIEPNNPDILSGLAYCEQHRGNGPQAIEYLERCIALRPGDAAKFSMLLLMLQFRGNLGKEAMFQKHLEYAERHERPLLQEPTAPHPKYIATQKLRVGYVSGDFRNHSVSCFVEPVLQFHNRDQVEVYCYYTFPIKDAATVRLQSLADHWRDCGDLDPAALAGQIRRDQIDVLIDLSGHTAHNRLLAFARRPAPVQATWLGYQSTTGLSTMGYRLTDASMDPPGQTEQFHTEELVRLRSAACFQPAAESPPVNALPALTTGTFTFGALHYPAKITQEAVQAWSDILKRVSGARLMLGYAEPSIVTDFTARFRECGMDTARLIFQPPVPLGEYLKFFHQIDVVLDSFPYNGGTTTLHSAWMGVPVIAIEGQQPISRAGAATMRGFGCEDFVVPDVSSYIERAVAAATDLERLIKVRAGLRERMRVVMTGQSKTLVFELEETYRRLRLGADAREARTGDCR